MKPNQKSQKLTKVKSNPQLKRDQSIKQLHLETLSKPKSLLVVHYREKRLSIPIFEQCNNGESFLTKNLMRFEQQILKSKSFQHFKSLIGYRTKDHDALKQYYFTIGKDISIFKLLEVQPIWRTPQQRKGCLYNGKTSKVYLTRHKQSGKFHALKLIGKDRINATKAQMIKNQENALKIVNNQFVVRLQDIFQTSKYVAFVMEYCHGGSLKYHTSQRQFTQLEAKFYVLQVLTAIQKLHQLKIVHQNIKLENILLDSDGHIRLSGFGKSFYKLLKNNNIKMKVNNDQGYMMDYFSIGTLCFQLLTGIVYQDQENLQLIKDIDLTQQAQHFLIELLQTNPNSRLGSLNGVKQIMSHPWLRNSNLQSFITNSQNAPIQPNMFIFYTDQQYQSNQNSYKIFQKQYQIVPEIISMNIQSEDQTVMRPIHKSPGKQMLKSRNLDKNKSKSRQKSGKVIRKTSNKKITINIQISKKKQIETGHKNLKKVKSAELLHSKYKAKRL